VAGAFGCNNLHDTVCHHMSGFAEMKSHHRTSRMRWWERIWISYPVLIHVCVDVHNEFMLRFSPLCRCIVTKDT
jgi:hypothetical protein